MTSIIQADSSFHLALRERIEYPVDGVLSKVLLKDENCPCTLFCLAADTSISKHTSTRNAIINVVEGRGILSLEEENIQLEPCIFVFMKANAPHALIAQEKLSFLLSLW